MKRRERRAPEPECVAKWSADASSACGGRLRFARTRRPRSVHHVAGLVCISPTIRGKHFWLNKFAALVSCWALLQSESPGDFAVRAARDFRPKASPEGVRFRVSIVQQVLAPDADFQ